MSGILPETTAEDWANNLSGMYDKFIIKYETEEEEAEAFNLGVKACFMRYDAPCYGWAYGDTIAERTQIPPEKTLVTWQQVRESLGLTPTIWISEEEI